VNRIGLFRTTEEVECVGCSVVLVKKSTIARMREGRGGTEEEIGGGGTWEGS
jgi:hypothetical protein